MGVIDFDLIVIVWLRIFEALLVLVCLVTGQWIRDEARTAGWSLATCRALTASAWAIALGSAGGFVSHTLWLEIGGLLAVAVTFLASGKITAAIAEHPTSRRMGSGPGDRFPAAGGKARADRSAMLRAINRWLGLATGVVLGGSAFFARSLPLGADIVLLGWLAARRPIPVVWISLLGVAAGLVGGGLVTVDPAPVTIALLAVAIVCLGLVLRRLALGSADANPDLPSSGL